MEIKVPISKETEEEFKVLLVDLANEVIDRAKEKEATYPEYLNKKQAAAYLNTSYNTLIKLERMGMKSIKIDGKILFRKKSIDTFMQSLEDEM